MGIKNKNKNKSKGAKRSGDARGTTEDGGTSKGNGSKVITDARFASVHSDPRFRDAPRHKTKVAIDSRFNRIFTDKNFAKSKAPVDKRGKRRKDLSQNALKHYYRMDEDDDGLDEDEDKHKLGKRLKRQGIERENSESEGGKSESESEDENSRAEKHSVDLRSDSESEEENESESEEEDQYEEDMSDDASTSTTDTDEDEDANLDDEEALLPEENVPEIDNETHRLAVVNMDWSRVKAVDLYVLLSSFLPKGGRMISVAVYPSEFGLQRMEEEAVRGPVGLFDDNKEKDENSVVDDEDDDEDEMDVSKLRSYELSRLRYYFAVVECDSVATADYLYKTCDGVEFERTSNKLDLRFIPDSMEFKHAPRDIASEAPTNYEGVDFFTRALQQSKVELTWDEDEPHRARTLKRKFDADQLADLELKEFLASDGSEGEDSEDGDQQKDTLSKKHKKENLYRALLQSADGNDEEGDQDMEVTFNTGLEDLSKRILEKKDRESETVWEAYLRKKKEKKKNLKNRSRNSSDNDSSGSDQEPTEQPDDFFIDQAPTKVSKETRRRSDKKGNQNQEPEEASKAELELLLADDDGTDANLKGYNLKRKKLKGKKGEILDEGKIPALDYDDPRFSALFTSPHFALDPTDPQFKRSATYARQIAQKQQKHSQENAEATEQQLDTTRPLQLRKKSESNIADEVQSGQSSSNIEKHELSSLVRSIKMKSKQVSLPSQAKLQLKGLRAQAKLKKEM